MTGRGGLTGLPVRRPRLHLVLSLARSLEPRERTRASFLSTGMVLDLSRKLSRSLSRNVRSALILLAHLSLAELAFFSCQLERRGTVRCGLLAFKGYGRALDGARACVRACVRTCVRACVRACARVSSRERNEKGSRDFAAALLT